MGISEAIAFRMKQLAQEREVTLYEIIKRGKLNQPTISEMIQGRTKHPRVSTILKFCEGCNITMAEFFDSPLFEGLSIDEPTTEETPTNLNNRTHVN